MDFWSSGVIKYSFLVTTIHHRALVEGAAFAKAVGKDCQGCESQAPAILCKMQEFQKAGQQDGFIAANLNQNGTIGERQNGRDTSALLSTILNFDPEAGCNEKTFQPCSERMLSDHKVVVDQFRSWEINKDIGPDRPVSLGRWAEERDGTFSMQVH